MPAYNKFSLSYLRLGLWSADLVESLETTISNGFVMNMSLSNNQATAKAKAESVDMNIAEEILVEHHPKKCKLDANFARVLELSGLNSVLSTLTNLVGIFYMYCEFLLTGTTLIPSMPCYINQVATCIMKHIARK